MKTIALERDRILKVYEYEGKSLLLEVGSKGNWEKSSHEIGFFSEKNRLFEELPRYFKNEELKRLKSNEEFLHVIRDLK